MVRIFCGAKLDIERFCQRFGEYLLQITTDDVLQNIISKIYFGRREVKINNKSDGSQTAVTQYYLNDQMIEKHQIQTIEICSKFNDLTVEFEKKFNFRLI